MTPEEQLELQQYNDLFNEPGWQRFTKTARDHVNHLREKALEDIRHHEDREAGEKVVAAQEIEKVLEMVKNRRNELKKGEM